MAITSISGAYLSALRGKYFDKKALEMLTPNLVLYGLADKKPLPQGLGDSVVWHRYIRKSTTVSAYGLTEGLNIKALIKSFLNTLENLRNSVMLLVRMYLQLKLFYDNQREEHCNSLYRWTVRWRGTHNSLSF